jgi:hypothetical protein
VYQAALGEGFDVGNFGYATCLVCGVNEESAGPKLKSPPQVYQKT